MDTLQKLKHKLFSKKSHILFLDELRITGYIDDRFHFQNGVYFNTWVDKNNKDNFIQILETVNNQLILEIFMGCELCYIEVIKEYNEQKLSKHINETIEQLRKRKMI